MNIFTVSFFGHRKIDHYFAAEQKLEKIICKLLLQKEYVEFLVGHNGDFDQLVSSTILRCKHEIRNDNSSLILVMPYLTAKYRNNQNSLHRYYDEIEVCGHSAAGHYKAAFQIRNQDMVDRSDLIVFYIEHPSGGAYQTMCYAQKKDKLIVNLSLDSYEPF